jgi:NAD-dependent deacetylase
MLRKKCWGVKPNEGHKLVAELEENYDVTVVTQNVDNLHEMAGSSKVIHLHGELMKVCSSRDVDDPRYIQQLTPENCEVAPGTKAGDGSLLRPYIVFFGEDVPRMEEAIILAEQADIFVIVGTSLNVYPAAGLVRFVPKGTPIFVIDPEADTMTAVKDAILLKATATEGMKKLVKLLKI